MTVDDQPEKDEKVLKKLATLFVEIPDSGDLEERETELQAHSVDIVRLGQKIKKIVDAAAEKDRLAWLEAYRKETEKGITRFPRPKTELPKARVEKLRLLESLQSTFADKGLPMAVGFKKLEELSDEDLSRIIEILQEEDEDSSRS